MKPSLEHSLCVARLRELLTYSPETGLFLWRSSRGRAAAGSIAGTVDSHGYVQIRIDGRFFRAHRLAWFFVCGEWPPESIDHINGDKYDNRISNLRNVCHQLNQQNQLRAHSGNRTGFMGASKNGSRWMARIKVDGKTKYLSNHETAAEAHAAYVEAKRKLHPGNTL